jgi:lipopolysaccharide export system permease protein
VRILAQKDTSSALIGLPESNRLAAAGDSILSTDSKVIASSQISPSDSIFQLPESTQNPEQNLSYVLDSINKATSKKVQRTEPLTADEMTLIDSLALSRGYYQSAIGMALNNSRSLKNQFAIKKTQIDNYQRDFRRFEIAWYQKYTQAFACFAMFLIGAPLGAIIKKGGLGMPVLISIIFFIVYYMLTMTGEKWAKEGLVDPLFGTFFSNICLIPFGLFFVKQARKDARLFEPDMYISAWKSIENRFKVLRSKSK